MTGICRECHGPVKSGGDIHPQGRHSFTPSHGIHRKVKIHRMGANEQTDQRGAPVARTGKRSASSKKQQKKDQ